MENESKKSTKGRKKKKLDSLRSTVFSQRLSELHEKSGERQSDTAELLGVSRQAFNAWTLGASEPDLKKLTEIASHFNTTTDYLLGLSDVEKPDVTLQAICSMTGLSEEAVEKLSQWSKSDNRRKLWSGYISIMIEHNSFEYLLSRLGNYLAASKVETLALKAGDKNDMEESLNEEMACLYAITKTLTDIIEDIGNQRRSQVWQAQS